jgi:hypothetical protein
LLTRPAAPRGSAARGGDVEQRAALDCQPASGELVDHRRQAGLSHQAGDDDRRVYRDREVGARRRAERDEVAVPQAEREPSLEGGRQQDSEAAGGSEFAAGRIGGNICQARALSVPGREPIGRTPLSVQSGRGASAV